MLAFKPERPVSPIQLRPGVKPNPPMHYRAKIIRHTAIRGVIFYAGSVVEVLPEDFFLLRASLKAERVDENTPLHNAPSPIDPATQIPARFLELVAAGLNIIGDLAQELATTKGNVAKIAARFIADGTVKVSDKGAYLIAKKA